MYFNRTLFEAGFDLVPDLFVCQSNNALASTGLVLAGITEDTTSNPAGDWVKLSHYQAAYLVLIKPAGATSDDVTVQIKQATDAAGSGSKNLSVSRLWYKKAASLNNFTAVPIWTLAEFTAASSLDLGTLNSIDLAADVVGTMIVIEVLNSSLDAQNSFKYVSSTITGSSVADVLIMSQQWVLQGGAYRQPIPMTALAG